MSDRDQVALRCSAAVLRNESVLLCRRLQDDRPTWVLPGGTPRQGESTSSCARREVLEETGLEIDPDRVAFVFETTSPNASHHLIEIVFLGIDRDPWFAPVAGEDHLHPEFIALDEIGSLNLLPPIAGYLRGFARRNRLSTQGTAAYLGNIWRANGAPSSAIEGS